MNRKKSFLIIITAVSTLFAGNIYSANIIAAEPGGLKRTHLLRNDLSVNGWEVLQDRVDFAPGAVSPTHSHPGEEIIYVLKGILKYEIKGQPAVTISAGKSLFIPAGTIHRATNVGDDNASEHATYVLKKGEQIITLHPSTVLP